MSLAKGIKAHVGFGGETTPGVKGTIDTFSPIISQSLHIVKDMFTSENVGGDWDVDANYGAERVEGAVLFEQAYTGNELFWRSLLRAYAYAVDTPVAGVNQHTFAHSASATSPAISIEGVNGIGGADETSYLGCRVQKATLEFAPRQALKTTFDILGSSTSSGTATTATFPTHRPILPAHKSTLTIGGTTLPVLSGNVEITLPRAADREHYGAGTFKDAVVIDRPGCTVALECEFNSASGEDSLAMMQALKNGTAVGAFSFIHQGDIITGSTKYEFGLTGVGGKVIDFAPTVQDNGILKGTVNIRVLSGLTLVMKNTTTAIS